MCSQIPIIDISGLIAGTNEKHNVAKQIGAACRDFGFFYITGHGIEESLQQSLEQLSRQFFSQPLEKKLEIRMALGGRAWRGFFPVGDELTSGKPDIKEGIYFGEELDDHHPLVKAQQPLHGRNLFPDIPQFRQTVLQYMSAMTALGHKLLEGIALSLGLDQNYFSDRYTRHPLTLFRIFNYPPIQQSINGSESASSWGVGEHTDYGVLTILKQDNLGGLEVKSQSRWIDAPPIAGSFVCNIGDMLDRMTGGIYRSTPHRVKSPTHCDRLSFPFFFDPNFSAEVKPIEGLVTDTLINDDFEERWDKQSVHQFSGTYGQYLLNKVSKAFPQLCSKVL